MRSEDEQHAEEDQEGPGNQSHRSQLRLRVRHSLLNKFGGKRTIGSMRAAVAICVCLGLLVTAAAASTTAITQGSIGAAPLGRSASVYRHVVGSRGLLVSLDNPNGSATGWKELVFAREGVTAYFRPGHKRSEVITTWDRRYRTPEGIGPCSLLDDLKLAYGKRVRPSPFNTQHGHVYAWLVGKNLIFAVGERRYVQAVGLYDGSDPRADKPGGSLPWAGYIVLSERTCKRS